MSRGGMRVARYERRWGAVRRREKQETGRTPDRARRAGQAGGAAQIRPAITRGGPYPQEKVASRPLRAGGHLRLPRSGRRRPVLKNPDELRLPRLAVPDKDVPAGSHLCVDELVQRDRSVGYIGL